MMAKDAEAAPEVCPVDHATREAWLKNNKSRPAVFPGATQEAAQASQGNSCDSSTIDQTAPPAKGFFSRFTTSPVPSDTPKTLALDREISSIPRASPVNNDEGAKPANGEKESGVSTSGNWIYPSEKMFFEAMKRKGYSSEAKDMKTIVPIHNAVNERAWKEIKEWERPWGSEEKCGGPKLHSFLGLSTTLSPKARFNTLLGYTRPFDRHDWVVDRCGTRIEYIIDFYAGKDEGKGKLNFFLDVRPKLNTWEGWKMRGAKII
ncbi:cytochrome c and c1 heme-lyase, partial [Acephala macrosclerotiorum]